MDFLLAATATGTAVLFTNPIEVVKTRLQLVGERATTATTTTTTTTPTPTTTTPTPTPTPTPRPTVVNHSPYNGIIATARTMARYEGARAFQRGLGPAVLYQVAMNGTRLGVYPSMRAALDRLLPTSDEASVTSSGSSGSKSSGSRSGGGGGGGGALSLLGAAKSFVAGAGAGVCGAVVGSPFFLAKIRLQSQSLATDPLLRVGHQHAHRTTFDCLASIARTEGVRGLWRGADAAAYRVASGSAAQLATYSSVKAAVMAQLASSADPAAPPPADTFAVHFASSMLTGVAVALAMNPMDVVATRMYNQKVDEHGRGVFYASTGACLRAAVRDEGVLSLYKGLLAHYLRVGPHTVLTFVFLEQLRHFAYGEGL